MKTRSYLLIAMLFLCMVISTSQISAQCPGGYNRAQLNWDCLDYLVTSGNYAGFVSTAVANNQFFAMGPNRVNIVATANLGSVGENATHTGNVTGYGDQDVEFRPSASGDIITITFETEVRNASFTLYDVDAAAVFNVSAVNTAAVAQTVIGTTYAGSILTVAGAVGKTITATVAAVANNLNTATVTLSVAGPVKTITITITNRGTDNEFWLSDIFACVTGSFPDLTYHAASRPWTGMPSYTIIVADSIFYLLDPATGYVEELFDDPGSSSMNSLGYDAINRIVYYTYNRSGPGGIINQNNKTIWKYNIDAETISAVTTDVTVAPLNIPTFNNGVESAGASFYNGSFYFGIEGYNSSRTSLRENIIWKIDFDASQAVTRATQVYAIRGDSTIGPRDRLVHDWSDFVASNGMIYDFDGAANGTAFTDSAYYHFNLMTGERLYFAPSDGIKPAQAAVDWQGQIYNMYGTVPGQLSQAIIAPYNLDGSMDLANQHMIFTLPGPVSPFANWADAAEAFRPNCDFGDAPASYDPDPLAPAVHERDTALRIGATFDREAVKTSSAGANADGTDEDGISFVPIFSTLYNYYLATVQVYNNTGSDATLMAWLDYNGNGLFDASEALAPIVVPSSPSMQSRFLYWTGISSPIPNGSFTYLRVRMVGGTGTMTSANATGYYRGGETEDYQVLVDNVVLSVDLMSFDARTTNNNSVKLTWNTADEKNLDGFEIQRSADNNTWTGIDIVAASGNDRGGVNSYNYTDIQPLSGKSYYRLKLLSGDGRQKYSDTRTIIFKGIEEFSIAPNPAASSTTVYINSLVNTTGRLRLSNINGQVILDEAQQIRKGPNTINVSATDQMPGGIYIVQLWVNDEVFTKKLIITKK
jgi:hypothetical protein